MTIRHMGSRMGTASIVSGSLALVLSAALTQGAWAKPLGYRFDSGAGFVYRVTNTTEPPSQGTIQSTVDYAFTAACPEVAVRLSAAISGTSNKFTVGNSTVTFDMDDRGTASNLTSPQVDHPIDGAFVKNAPGLFPPLPAGDVAVGQSWTVQAVQWAPKLDMPGSFTKIRTSTTYTYKGSQTDAAGRTQEILDFHTVEAPGESVKADVKGRYLIDLDLGRPVSTQASGNLKVKVAFMWVTVPTRFSLTEVVPSEAD